MRATSRRPSRAKRRLRKRPNKAQLELGLMFEPAAPPRSTARPDTVTPTSAPKESAMGDEIILMREVVRRTKRHRSTIYRWMDSGEFPAPLRTKTGRAIGWSRLVIESWIQSPTGTELLAAGSS